MSPVRGAQCDVAALTSSSPIGAGVGHVGRGTARDPQQMKGRNTMKDRAEELCQAS